MRKSYTTKILAATGLCLLASYGQVTAQQKSQPKSKSNPVPVYEHEFKGNLHSIRVIPHLRAAEGCLKLVLDEYAGKKGVTMYALLFDGSQLSRIGIAPKNVGQSIEEEIRALARGCDATIMPNNNLKKKNER